jgi:2'-hydroxyisoflavone reductase
MARTNKPLSLLILGGTVFLGRALVEAALARGHQVTLFNRGRHNPDLFPEVEKLRGDRTADLAPLRSRRWDAVIDTSGYVPGVVAASAELLAGATGHYTFISTMSVYADVSRPGMNETAPLAVLPEGAPHEVNGETYGPLKVLCEQAVNAALPGRALIVRPGLIVGPHDPTDRFTYWPVRLAAGGEVLAPGRPERQVQFIDVRDLAGWTLRMVEAGQVGIYNATGPAARLSMATVLDVCAQAAPSGAHLTWVPEAWLLERGVEAWSELPLWLPESEPGMAGLLAFDVSKALAAGLAFRPLADTVRDTLTWAAARPADHAWQAGLSRARESELLDAWHRRA